MSGLADVYAELRNACELAGGQKQWAERQKPPISTGHVCDVLNARVPPGPKILRALGFRRVVTYQRSNHA